MTVSAYRRVAGAAALVIALLACGAPAAAAEDDLIPVPQTGAAGLLSLSSSIYPLTLPVLQRGEAFTWQMGVHLDQPHGSASLQVTADGEIVGTDTYLLTVDECDSAWKGSSGLGGTLRCASAVTSRIAPVTLAAHRQDVQVPLRDLRAGSPPHLRFTLSRPASSPDPSAMSLTLGIGITSMGRDEDGVPPGQPPTAPLADTGAVVLQTMFAGLGLLLLGAAVLALRPFRRQPEAAE